MNIIEKTASAAEERLRVGLRHLEWAQGLSDETLGAIANRAEWVEFRSGEVIIEVDSEVTHAYFLITGRAQVALYDYFGREMKRETFVRGSLIGLFSMGLRELSHLQVEATEPLTALRLTLANLLELTAKHPDFQLAMFRLAANLTSRNLTIDRSRPKPSVVAIIHHSEASRPLARELGRRLRALGESPCTAGDDEQWKPEADVPFRLLAASRVEEWYDILKDWAAAGRLLIDLRADHGQETLSRVLPYADMVLWCVRPQDARAAVEMLAGMEKGVPRWRDKIRLVWLLDNGARFPPYVPELHEIAERDFKLTFDAPGRNQGSLLQHGLERIIHHLRGIQIGLALGGGAARGMAHLGVLKALEQHGIYVDMMAGTSAGAMTGVLYAADLDPEYLTRVFKTSLRPPWFFRHLRGGGYWYLLYKYRRNQFDSMLREHLGRVTMSQLVLPMFTVSVDLVEGDPMIGEAGDATTNILESINLPPLALPIFASDQALVDGGLLNNIPADVLVSKGCNFVIASSVTAKLEKDFAGLRSHGRFHSSRLFSTLQVIMRQTMIQGYHMNAVGVHPADFVIAPDVTAFDISEFTRADEMASIGERTASDVIPMLRKMLVKLDAKLFAGS